jgi:thioredoxin-related protein
MKLVVFIWTFICYSLALGQIDFDPISELNASESKVKVIMLSADWCTICRVNQSKMERRNYLKSVELNRVDFFKLEEKHSESIVFDGKIHSFEQMGMNEGCHQLITYLMNGKVPVYPTFIFLNENNQIVESWSGFIGESEMESVLYGILNQIDAPDSVKSN